MKSFLRMLPFVCEAALIASALLTGVVTYWIGSAIVGLLTTAFYADADGQYWQLSALCERLLEEAKIRAQWEIDDDDGAETIEEKHRSWR